MRGILRERIERLEVVRRDEVKARQPFAFKYRFPSVFSLPLPFAPLSSVRYLFLQEGSSSGFCINSLIDFLFASAVMDGWECGGLCRACHPSTLTAGWHRSLRSSTQDGRCSRLVDYLPRKGTCSATLSAVSRLHLSLISFVLESNNYLFGAPVYRDLVTPLGCREVNLIYFLFKLHHSNINQTW